ncbi:MAG: hypothetical protein ACJ77K_18335 [Bacteroidia bacterium]
MKKLLLFTVCFIGMSSCFAQVSLEEGITEGNEKDCRVEKMLGRNEKSFYMLKFYGDDSGKHYLLERYISATMKKEFSKSIDISDEKNATYVNAFYTNGKVFVFREMEDKERKVKALMMQVIDEDGNASPDLTRIFECSIAAKMGMMVRNKEVVDGYVNLVDYFIELSPDRSKFLFIAETRMISEITTGKDLAKIMNLPNLAVSFDKELPGKYREFDMSCWNYRLSDKGDIYFNFNYTDSDNSTKLAVGKIIPSKSPVVEAKNIEFDRRGQKVEDTEMTIRGDKVFCVILYKTRKKEKEKENLAPLFGVFEQTSDLSSLKVLGSDSMHFSTDIARRISTGSSFYFRTYRIAGMQFIGDNMYTVIEQTSLVKGSFVIVKFTGGKKIDWMKPVIRNYDIHAERNNHFLVYSTEDKLYLLFGEDENMTKKPMESLTMDNCKRTSEKNADVVAVSIDEKGNMSKNTVYKRNKMILRFIEKDTNIPDGYYSTLDFGLIAPAGKDAAIVYIKGHLESKLAKLSFN